MSLLLVYAGQHPHLQNEVFTTHVPFVMTTSTFILRKTYHSGFAYTFPVLLTSQSTIST